MGLEIKITFKMGPPIFWDVHSKFLSYVRLLLSMQTENSYQQFSQTGIGHFIAVQLEKKKII